MSSSDPSRLLPRLAGKSFAHIAVAIFAVAMLGGCFRPLYGVSASGPSVQDQLAAIELTTINPDLRNNNRLSYYTQSELAFRLNGGSPNEAAKYYELQVMVSESVASTIINTSTGNAEAALLTGNADFKLLPAGGGKPLFSGRAVASSAYDRTPQRFASLRAANDAQIRIAKALAEQIQTRIAARFASGAISTGQ